MSQPAPARSGGARVEGARFEGVFPIVNTTFREDGSIDLDSQRRLVRFLLDAGAHGLGLFGNASEGYTLAADERVQLLRAIVREVDGRVPVIVSSGHTGTDLAVALSREAEAGGADGLMIMPPHLMKPDAEGVFHYFRAISDAVRIPIMVQDAPLMSGVAIGAPLIARMARELERVRYVKVEAPPTAPKISAILDGYDLKGDEAPPVLFGGLNGQFLLEELDRGAVGTMPGSDLTAAFVAMWDLWRAGDRAGARREFARYLPLIRYELQPGLGVAVMKHNLVAAGVIASARVRHPTRELDAAGLREIGELRADLPQEALGWA
ncbi:dihydrodipicolinate synthase family protein [Luteimonas suaedae]|uniref:dihydrodipicolinate synthase family protein n=1 Tax=Luteimonas suaedae TaxID=2605430 RepID=UPI001658E7C8|nr:dihydrodipicolinate synthase family protein [Luteimonas suaedae]